MAAGTQPFFLMNRFQFKPALYGILWASTLAVAYHLGRSDGDGGGVSANGSTDGREAQADQISRERIAASQAKPSSSTGNPNAEEGNLAGELKSVEPVDFRVEFESIMGLPPGPERNHRMEECIGKWAMQDGKSALSAASAISEPLLRYTLWDTALRKWASADPEAAWTHALANPTGDLPEERMRMVLNGLGRADVGTALAFFQKHSNGELMPYMESTIGAFDKLYERGGHDIMVPWAQNLPAGKMKDGAVNRIIDQWARYDPASAAKWMDSMLAGNPKNTVDARIELTESWARVNPTEALNYVNSLPADQRENSYYERIFKRWLDYDKKNAAAFLADQPSSPALDRPIERYAYDVMNQNPAATMPWAESIADPNRRMQVMERVADAWRKRDPNGLQNYVSSANYLSNEQKAKLLKLKTK